MTNGEDERSKEVLTVGKKDKDEVGKPDAGKAVEKEKPKRAEPVRESEPARDRDRDRREPQPAPQSREEYPPRDDYYGQPPPQPLFTASNLQKVLAIGILICVILLFVGTMLGVGARYVEPEDNSDLDLKRNLSATGILLGAIGLFLLGLFAVISLMQIRDLADNQKLLIVIVIIGILISFAFLINNLVIF